MEEKGSDFVQIKSPSEHLSKRQATLQVMFRGTGDQPRLAIIFAGAGKVYNDSPGLAGAEKAYMDNLIHSKTGSNWNWTYILTRKHGQTPNLLMSGWHVQ